MMTDLNDELLSSRNKQWRYFHITLWLDKSKSNLSSYRISFVIQKKTIEEEKTSHRDDIFGHKILYVIYLSIPSVSCWMIGVLKFKSSQEDLFSHFHLFLCYQIKMYIKCRRYLSTYSIVVIFFVLYLILTSIMIIYSKIMLSFDIYLRNLF
jgi:hypothetical protein